MEADTNLFPLADGVPKTCTKMSSKEECNGCEEGNPGLVLSTRAVCRGKEPCRQLGILPCGSVWVRR